MIILVHGLPATGKTTLAKRLTADLQLPLIGKDTIKEFLFDILGHSDREWSRHLGVAATKMVYALIEEFLSMGKSLIVENAFDTNFAVHEIGSLLTKHNGSCLEIYCTTDEATRVKRFTERAFTSARHPGHADQENARELADAKNAAADQSRYAPLRFGQTITIDTTMFGDHDYESLLEQIRHALAM